MKYLALLPIICYFISIVIALEGRRPERKLKILVNNPAIGWSHSQFLGRICDELIIAGHEVHILFYNLNSNVGNYTGSKLVTKVYRHQSTDTDDDDDRGGSIPKELSATQLTKLKGQEMFYANTLMSVFYDMMVRSCRKLVADDQLLSQLKAEHYDVGIMEYFDRCIHGIFHHVGVKTKILASAVTLNTINLTPFGAPSFSSYNFNFNTICADKQTGELTFFERAYNTYEEHYEYYVLRGNAINKMQAIFERKFGADFPKVAEFERNQSLLLVNSNEFFSLPRAITPKVVFIGGIVKALGNASSLNKDLRAVFDTSKRGVILFSLGTMFDYASMEPHARNVILRAFEQFPDYDFVWKFQDTKNNSSTLPEVPPNVHMFKWIDQKVVLAHPRTRLFITHCGLNSANEAVTAGVPVVGIPLFGDQFMNAALLGRKRVGIIVDIARLVVGDQGAIDMLASAIRKVLEDRQFAENAELLKRKLKTVPFGPSERLVKWVEFAAEFPDLNELNLPSADEMGWLRYYNADVLAAFVMVVISGTVGVSFVLWSILIVMLRLVSLKSSDDKKMKSS